MIDHLAVIAEESRRFADILRQGPLDAAVPGTPDWNLAELGAHMVNVQSWATAVVAAGQVVEAHEGPVIEDSAAALEASCAKLIETLKAADPQGPCWNFTAGPQVVSFWFRRQANEVAMHRWDAESAITADPAPLDPEHAVDIVDEFIHYLLNRVISRQGLDISALSSDVHLHATDAHGEWTFEVVDGELVIVDEHRKAAVAVKGSASDLALFIHNRGAKDRVEIFGDAEALRDWEPIFAF